ncbi:MAG: type II CAAX endopeptidase family protein [Candidatus Bilamarchaeaceae archaeon]
MMNPKNIFAAGFFASVMAFTIFVLVSRESYLYEIFIHTSLLFAALYIIWKGNLRSTLSGVGVPGSIKTNIVWTICGFILVFITMLALAFVLSAFDINDNYKVYGVIKKIPSWLLMLAVFGAPITEELFFRAALLQRLSPVFGSAGAITLSAIAFGLSHVFYGSVTEIIGATVIGMVLAFIFIRTNSVVPPITVHFGFNLSTIVAVMYGGG